MHVLGIKEDELCNSIGVCELYGDHYLSEDQYGHEDCHYELQPLPYGNIGRYLGIDDEDPLHPAMLALCTQPTSITEVEMDAYLDDGLEFPTISLGVFHTSLPQSRYMACVFPTLTKLHLDLNSQTEEPDRLALQSRRERHTATALSAAINLEALYLRVWDDDRDPQMEFDVILGGCRYPRLKSLMLEGLVATEDQLTHFVQSSPYFEHLFIDNMALSPASSSSWACFADAVRRSLALKSAGLLNLQWKSRLCDSPLPVNDEVEFEDFFLRGAENPLRASEIISIGPILRYEEAFGPRDHKKRWQDHYRWTHQGRKRPAFAQAGSDSTYNGWKSLSRWRLTRTKA